MEVINKLDSYDKYDKLRKNALVVKRRKFYSSRLVVLEVGDEKVTVSASDLIEAVKNAKD